MMKRIILIIVILGLTGIFVIAGQKLVYTEKTKTGSIVHSFDISQSDTGYIYSLISEQKDQETRQIFVVTKDLATRAWEYENEAEKTKVKAIRENNIVLLTGIKKGEKIEKKFKINSLTWNQLFHIGLQPFVLGDLKKLKFWAIGTSGPGYMKMGKLSAKKKKPEIISIMGKSVKALHVQIKLSGLLSIFWTGNYWFRITDGLYLKYQAKGGPDMVMELVKE